MRNRIIVAMFAIVPLAVAVQSRAAEVDFLHLLLTRPTVAGNDDEQKETGLKQSLDWQRLTLLDEHGRFNNRGLAEANLHRQQHLPPRGPKAHSINGFTPVAQSLNWYNWVSRGPINVGGRTRALLVLPTNSQVIYAGAASGGVWVTGDGGTTWTPLTDRWANTAISSLAFDSLNSSTIYAGTGESTSYYDAIGGVGIIKSTDGGYNWVNLASTIGWPAVRVLAAQPNVSGVLLAGTDNGIYRTSNGGTTWTKVHPNGANTMQIWSLSFDPSGNNAIATGSDGGVRFTLFSTDAGLTFNDATVTASNGFDSYAQYARSSPLTVYLHRPPFEVFKSVDGGHSYTLTSTQTNQFCYYTDVCTMWVSPTNPNLLVVGGLDLWRSVNGGVNFTKISNWGIESPGGTEPHGDQHVIVNDPNNASVVYVGNDGGVYKASDINLVTSQSNYWVNRNRTYQTTQFYNAAGNTSGIGIYLGGTQDNGSLLTSPTTVFSPFRAANEASRVYCCDGGWVAIDPVNPNFLYVEAQVLSPGRSTDGGNSAFFMGSGITDHDFNANFIAPIVMDPNNPATLLAGGRNLWRTTNANSTSTTPTWSSIRPPSNDLPGSSQPPIISAIAVAPGNSNIIWVGLDDGRIEKTTNGTATTPTWTQIDNGSFPDPLPQRYVLSIYIDPANSNVVYVTLGGYSTGNVWRTADGGTTWSNIHGLLPAIPIRTIVRHPRNAQQLYVGGDVGVYSSADGGQTWITTEEGPADVAVHSLNFVTGSELLLAGTHGRGMWTADVSDVPTLAPSGLVASMNGATSIILYWTGVTGASSYQVWRSSDGAAYSVVATVSSTAGTVFYTDTTVAAGKTYLYKVNTTINSVPTQFSNVDLATTVSFTSDYQLQGQLILASHLQQIRDAVNLVRAAAALTPLTFSPAVTPGITIGASDITVLRNGLIAAYAAIGMPAPSFTDTISAGVLVKAAHYQEIRDAVK